MVSEEQLAQWAAAKDALENARILLTAPLRIGQHPPGEIKPSLEAYEEFLDHNELGLALDVLVSLGDLSEAPSEFWSHLELAAGRQEMNNTANYAKERAHQRGSATRS